jgi:cytochrome c-type biogenesis protein
MDLIRDIGFVASFWGGFSAFFSAWQLCIMQISPFFLFFIAGFYLTETKHSKNPISSLLLVFLAYLLAFSIVFAFMGIPRFGISRYLLYNKEALKIVTAVYIALLALYLVLCGIYQKWRVSPIAYLPVGALLGASLAVAYSPCITPAMSDIMNFAGRPENVIKGYYLLLTYAAGLSTAFALSGATIALSLDHLAGKIPTIRNIAISFASIALFAFSFLLASGLMTSYKSFLVGLVLD